MAGKNKSNIFPSGDESHGIESVKKQSPTKKHNDYYNPLKLVGGFNPFQKY